MIDVIIPSFNDKRIINTIKTIKNFEVLNNINIFKLIIIDGGSDFILTTLIKNNISTNDLLLIERDNGIFDALNKGLNAATNDFIWWIGSDDLLNINIPNYYFEFFLLMFMYLNQNFNE